MKKKLKILFLCTGNSCRSQMAEGLTRHFKGAEIDTYSAGVKPKGLDPLAIVAMKEINIDITSQTSKHIDSLKDIKFDYVITVCDHAAETCPILPGSKIYHHSFNDPPKLAENCVTQEEKMIHYRRVRDEIKNFVLTLPESLEEKK